MANNKSPVTIPIGTSNPVDLSLGLPLFPDLGTARAGISASARSYKLFDIPILIVCTRLNLSVYAGYGFGIVGPAIAFLSKNVNVGRQNLDGGGAQLTLNFDGPFQMEAGAFIGAFVSGGVTANLQVYAPDPWYKVWAWTWKNVFTINKDFKIDLLKLMYDLIKYLLSKKANAGSFTEDKSKKLEETKLGIQGFSMVGASSGVRPDLTATPEVTAPLNLANYVPKLREINQGLAKIDGEISFGPTAHFQYPVIFNFDGFTVEGGLQGGVTRGNYGNVSYGPNRVTATGPTLFNERENPSRFTTNVRYRTTVRLAISIHAQVKVAKFFSIGVNTPSLDLTSLLFRRPESRGTVPVTGSVSTNVGGGCVLTPNMTLRFEGPDNNLEILTGQIAEGTVNLAGFRSGSDATVKLEIDPPAANFPTSVIIPADSRTASFRFSFQNQNLPTGNRNDPAETAPPSPLSALQSYSVRATLVEQPAESCSDYQAETPLSITNRVLRFRRYGNTFGALSPPWDALASATIDAAVNNPNAPNGSIQVPAVLSFPYVSDEQTQTVPLTFTLLDENREPYGSSDVELSSGNDRKSLTPSCTLNVTLVRAQDSATANSNLTILWKSKGPVTGYPNRFYLLVNGGREYGQTEFWLQVFNWS